MKFLSVFAVLAGIASAADPISEDLFNRIKYYAVLGGAATIAAPCTTPGNGFVPERQLDTAPTWTNTSATLFRNDNTREYVLAFSASNNSVNNNNNLDATLVTLNGNFPCGDAFNTCKIHRGFQTTYGSATDSRDLAYMVRATVKSATSARPAYALTLVGSSLGGALASQAFLDLSNQGYAIKAVWTYGEPRVGNGALVDLVDNRSGSSQTIAGKYYRVTHYDDGVVKLPAPGPIGPDQWQHSLTEYWFSREECKQKNTPSSTFRCYGREDVNCNYGTPPTSDTIKDHETYPGYENVKCANRPFNGTCDNPSP